MTGWRGDTLRIEPELARAMRRLRALPAHEAAYAAGNVLLELEGAARLVEELRSAAIGGLRGDGLTWAEIGELIDEDGEAVRRRQVKYLAATSPAVPAAG